ncbi:MAG: hypothetical protein HOV78_16500 [Hamadaea sp.]|nr:hypothetical protein [Hamadaea sp.]
MIERPFRLRHYMVSHTRLILHSFAQPDEPESFSVLFGGVQAMHLHTRVYHPLIIEEADEATRAGMLAFAAIPERIQDRMLCLTLPDSQGGAGSIVCYFASVFARPRDQSGGVDARAFDEARHIRTIGPR